jgi:hypothetical protein
MDDLTQDRKQAIEQARTILAEHFDCGLAIVSWEDEGTTYNMTLCFGNAYAVENMADRATEILELKADDDEEEIEA